MIKEGCLNGVQEVYGLHNWPTIPVGEVRVCPGPIMAQSTEFRITVVGRGGHASTPHATIDPVACSAALVSALNTIVSRSVPSSDRVVLSVTNIHAGEALNVIPDKVEVGGTIRTFDDECFKVVERRVHEVALGCCAAFGAHAQVSIVTKYPPVINHEVPAAIVQRVAKRVLGDSAVSADGTPLLGGEDFSYFLREDVGGLPGAFFLVGTREEEYTQLASIHTPGAFASPHMRSNCICHATGYDFNDNAIPYCARLWIRLVEDRLGCVLYEDGEI